MDENQFNTQLILLHKWAYQIKWFNKSSSIWSINWIEIRWAFQNCTVSGWVTNCHWQSSIRIKQFRTDWENWAWFFSCFINVTMNAWAVFFHYYSLYIHWAMRTCTQQSANKPCTLKSVLDGIIINLKLFVHKDQSISFI